MKLSNLFTKAEYTVGYRFSEDGILADTVSPFKTMNRSSEYWYADPFVYFRDGEYYVFMEVMSLEKGYAGIGYSKLVNGILSEPETVIDYGKHLSFPFIFDYKGETYIMPESCSESKIKLFRCVSFPDKWEEAYSLTDNRSFYDSVVFEYGQKTYLFTSHSTSELYGSKLYLMELEHDTAEPKIISEQEITDDSRNARQAGKMLMKDGKLIRVAQDCSKKEYGRALEFFEVDSLDSYSEHLIKHIGPDDIKTEKHISGKSGVHTYNRVNNFEVIDLKISRFYAKAVFVKTKMLIDMIFKNKAVEI